MKAIQSSIFRAIGAIIVGVLLIQYREETVRWITILMGVIFFLSGVFSIVAYYSGRSRETDIKITDANGNPLNTYRPAFPIVGLGSLILGVVLALTPTTFIAGLTYIFAAILILGAINQLMILTRIQRIAKLSFIYWIAPSIILLIGVLAIGYPQAIASAPLFIIGWCMLVYGVTECINAIKTYTERRKYEQLINKQIEDATIVQEETGNTTE